MDSLKRNWLTLRAWTASIAIPPFPITMTRFAPRSRQESSWCQDDMGLRAFVTAWGVGHNGGHG